jgi:hypothetical protein
MKIESIDIDALKQFLTEKLAAGIPAMVDEYVASQGYICVFPSSEPVISDGRAEADFEYAWPEESKAYTSVTAYTVERPMDAGGKREFLIAQEVGGRKTYGRQREAIVVFLRQGSPQPIYEFTQTDKDPDYYACIIKQTKRHAADIEDYQWTQAVDYLTQASVVPVTDLFESAGANAKTLRLVVNASDHHMMLLHALDKVERILKL